MFFNCFVNPAYAAPNGFINFENGKEFTSNSSVQLFALVTLLSLSSSIVLLFTHFTYFMIVLGITRQGLGVMNLPPNQVLVGLTLFYHSYDAACTWATEERCVGSDDERENNGKSSCGDDSSYYEKNICQSIRISMI